MTYVPHHAEDTCLNNRPSTTERSSEDTLFSETSIANITYPSSSYRDQEKNYSRRGGDEETGSLRSYGGTPIHRHVSSLTFPEGGLRAWLVVLGSFCAMLSVYGLINTAAVFESYFSEHQLAAYSPSQIGWIFSLYLFVVFFVGIQVGPVFDRYGPRVVVAVGGVLIAASMLILSFCETYYQILLAYSFLGGLGGAMLNSPAYAAIAHFFNLRRGLATGIAATSGSIGGIAFPILLQRLLPTLGFAWTSRVLGFILLALAVPANLFIRSRLPRGDKVASVWPDLTVFRDTKFLLSAVGIFFMEWGLFVPLTFIVSYAAAHGQDATQAYTLLSLLNAGSVLGRFVPGFLADKIGRFNVILMTIVLCVATVFGLWLPAGDSQPMLVAFAVLFGFASGSNLGLIPVCLGQLCDARDYGRFFSTAMMVASFGTLSSLPIAGRLLEVGPPEVGWTAVIVFAGAAYTLAFACYAAARVLAVGWGVSRIF
jgi:MFS family permease